MKHESIVVAVALTVLAMGGLAASSFAQTHYVGAVGDSLTDEYFEQDLPPLTRQYDYAQSWFELIVNSGKASGGQLSTGTWGEPRRTGYEYNFARWAAVSADLPAQVAAMKTTFTPSPPGIEPNNHFVGACIGANDFFPSATGNYFDFYTHWQDIDFDTEIKPIIDHGMAITDAALDDALASNVNLVLANIPDYGIAHYTYNDTWGAGYTDGAKRENIAFVVSYVNAELARLANQKEIPLVDIYRMTKEVFGNNTDADAMDPTVTKQLGGVDIYVHLPDVLTGGTTGEPTNPQAAWVHDGIHPHTTIQGVFANLFMEASNLHYGTNLTLFTEAELVENAGLTYGGQDTLFSELGPEYNGYGDFIILPEPVPGDFDSDGDVDGSDFLKWQRGEVSTPPSTTDLATWQAEYGTSTSSSGDSAAVPEPIAGLLGVVTVLLGISFRRHY